MSPKKRKRHLVKAAQRSMRDYELTEENEALKAENEALKSKASQQAAAIQTLLAILPTSAAPDLSYLTKQPESDQAGATDDTLMWALLAQHEAAAIVHQQSCGPEAAATVHQQSCGPEVGDTGHLEIEFDDDSILGFFMNGSS